MNLFQKVVDEKNDFTTFPKSFENYRWFKPILVFIVMFLIFIVLNYLPNFILGHTKIDFATWSTALTSYFVIIFIPCVYIASKVIRDRPFSSYISSVGRWNWGIFIKTLLIALIISALFAVFDIINSGERIDFQLTLIPFLSIIFILPIQCFAEELVFRGYVMQTVGSWFKIPIIAIIVQAILFAFFHSYNPIGLIGVLACGLCFGFIAWYSKGLEISTALHTVNNVLTGLTSAIVVSTSTNVTLFDSIEMTIKMVLIIAVIILIDKKSNWIGLKRETNA